MRKLYISLILLSMIAFGLSATAETSAKTVADILASSTKTVVGVSLSKEQAGRPYFGWGPGIFVEWEGVSNQYLLVADQIYSDGTGSPSYNVYLPTGMKSASIVSYTPDFETAIIKLKEPYADAVAIKIENMPVNINEEYYLVYVLPRAFSHRTAVMKIRATSADKIMNFNAYASNVNIGHPSLEGANGGIVYDAANRPVGFLGKMPVAGINIGYIISMLAYREIIAKIKERASMKKVDLKPSEKPGWFGAITTVNTQNIFSNLPGASKPKLEKRDILDGVFISGTLNESPAGQANFKPMDLIVEVNGIRLAGDYTDIEALFASFVAGTSVKVSYMRYNQQAKEWALRDTQITVQQRPETSTQTAKYDNEFFKIQACNFTWDLRIKTFIMNRFNGVYLTKVAEDSLLYFFGIPADSVIVKVNGVDTPDIGAFKAQIEPLQGKSNTKVEFLVCLPDGYNMPIYKQVKLP